MLKSSIIAQSKGHITFMILRYIFLTYLEFGGLSSCIVLRYLVSSPVINIRMPEGVNNDCY
jgi:hypothetical protein